MSKRIRGVAVLLSVIAAACGKSGPFAGPRPDTLHYAMKDASKGTGECRSTDSAKTPTPCVRVNLIWPEITDSTVGARMAKEFIARLIRSSFTNGNDVRTADSVVTEVVALHDMMTKSHKEGYDVPWLAERKVSVACNEPGRFGIRLFSNQFLGGTHATAATRYANFDTRTGQAFGLEQVVAKEKSRALKEAAMATYSKRQGVAGVADLKLNPDSFPEPRSALVCGDSLVLQYDVLTFGPHRSIGTEIVVAKDALKGIVR